MTNGRNRPSRTRRRIRSGLLAAAGLLVAYAFFLPVANYFLLDYAKDEAFRSFVAPQIGQDRIALSSRLLPRLKNQLWRQEIDIDRPSVILIGNSTQFQMSRALLAQAFNCSFDNYYNFAYHSIDPHDTSLMLHMNGVDLRPGSTVLFAVYPEMFLLAARQGAPSIDHPWADLDTWLLNIQDGNTSIVSLYPIIVNIEWPISPGTTFPFFRYYDNVFDLLRDGQPNEYYYHDGSVEFIDIPRQQAERVARGEALDTANFRARAMATANDPYHEFSFRHFADVVGWLAERGIRSVAFEAVLNPAYGFARRESPAAMRPYLDFMAGLDAAVPLFEYVSADDTYVEVPDALWYDDSHVSREGAEIVGRQLARVIDHSAVCVES